MQVIGVGRISALSVLALLLKLELLQDGQAASLAELASINRDSGQHRGQRHIHGGHPAVSKALYMTALA